MFDYTVVRGMYTDGLINQININWRDIQAPKRDLYEQTARYRLQN